MVGLRHGGTPPTLLLEELAEAVKKLRWTHNRISPRIFDVEPDDFSATGEFRIAEVVSWDGGPAAWKADPLLPARFHAGLNEALRTYDVWRSTR